MLHIVGMVAPFDNEVRHGTNRRCGHWEVGDKRDCTGGGCGRRGRG